MNGGFAMTGAHSPTEMSGGKPVAEECRTIREQLAANAPETLAPDEARAVGAHLAACAACRAEHVRPAAVPAHLTMLCEALAHGQGRERRAGAAAGPGGSDGPVQRRGAERATARQITLSQWVSKTASYAGTG
ncbi:zf-HC2 domain-containing protein [Streptomyces sp. NPDC057499]|uniref:zf-HC2 domain-containing protein n=1 Tax=Streptomyces sp. NPDC057499 TaxID=3346150 RepID=UPI0036C8D578